MGAIFKNKFFVITLIVAVALTLSTVALNLSGHGSLVGDAVNVIVTPFRNFAVIVKDSFSGIAAYFTEFGHMKEEIEELRAKLADAESQLLDTRRLQDENETLMAFYELKRKRPDYKMQNAKVTARDPGNLISSLTIDKGAAQGLEKDRPVVAARGTDSGKERYVVVGYVGEVGLLSAKVVPFIRAGAAIGAYVERTGEAIMVVGDFGLERKGLCKIANVPKGTILEVGDKIYSSGSGGIYPEDLYIGEIVELVADPLSRTMTGYVKPAVDFEEIKNIMVILEFSRY